MVTAAIKIWLRLILMTEQLLIENHALVKSTDKLDQFGRDLPAI